MNTDQLIQQAREELAARIKFENLVFHLRPSNFNETVDMMNQYIDNSYWVQMLITKAAFLCPFCYRLLGNLFEKTGSVKYQFHLGDDFSQYLFVRGIITEDNIDEDSKDLLQTLNLKEPEDYEEPIKENTLAWYIAQDNVAEFLSYVTLNNIDLIENDVGQFKFNNWIFYGIQNVAVFCGSVNIVKYLYSIGVEFDERASSLAMNSGNEEIVDFLAQKGETFKNTFMDAVIFHNNDLARWAKENWKNSIAYLSEFVSAMNTDIFFYILETYKRNINEQDEFLEFTALHEAVQQNDLLLTKYLLFKGLHREVKDDFNKTALDYAISPEMTTIFEM